jgi:uncharacterized protein
VTESSASTSSSSGYRFVLLGLAAGVLSGLFGVGGGFLVVPILIKLGIPTKRAAATSLAGVIPIAVAALIPYAADRQVHLGVAGILAVGGFIGTSLGTTLLKKVRARTIQYAFAALLLVAAIRLAIVVAEGEMGDLTWKIDLGLALLGLSTGVLSGLLGVGGGFIMVPGMMVIASMPSVLAKGTSLAAIIPTAIYGTFRNLRSDLVDKGAAVRVAGGGAVASLFTALVAVDMNQRIANGAFAALMLTLAFTMWRSAHRMGSEEEVTST